MKRFIVLFWGTVALGWPLAGTAQTPYIADGTPTGAEEEIRWRVNRGRFDTASENQARGTTYTNVIASTGPLAPNQALTLASRHQSEDMAKHNVFQHTTVTNSAYYNWITQPNPWDRMTAEGYSWNTAGENIAAGYSSADAVYVGWWNSTGHRQNMYNSGFREIGCGYYYWPTSSYHSYYNMDLGASGNTRFFTDTLFYDGNGSATYEQGEGVTGVSVRLVAGAATQVGFDVSTSVGSFAIPIQSVASGASVQVILSNTTASSVQLSIPKDYRSYTTVSLAASQSRAFGTFVQPSNLRNIGWRDVTPAVVAAKPPRLLMSKSGTDMVLRWQADTNLEYVVQRSTNLVSWSNVVTNSGTSTNLTWRDVSAGTSFQRAYYRLLARPR